MMSDYKFWLIAAGILGTMTVIAWLLDVFFTKQQEYRDEHEFDTAVTRAVDSLRDEAKRRPFNASGDIHETDYWC